MYWYVWTGDVEPGEMPTLAQRCSHMGSGLDTIFFRGNASSHLQVLDIPKLLSDLPRSCSCHRPTTPCSCSAVQDGPGWSMVILWCFMYPIPTRWVIFHSPTQRMGANCILPTWESLKMSTKRWYSGHLAYAQNLFCFRLVSSLPLPLAPSLWSLCTSQDQLCSRQKTPLLPWQETTLVLPHGTNRCHCYCLNVSLLLKSQLVEDLI